MGGIRRHWVISHQTAGNQRAGGTTTKSFAEAGLPADADLRDPAQAAKLEALILKHAGKPDAKATEDAKIEPATRAKMKTNQKPHRQGKPVKPAKPSKTDKR